CFTGTAERNGQRLITVVMGVEPEYNDSGTLVATGEKKRFLETKKLLDFGFSNFEQQELFPAGFQLEEQTTLPVVKGKEKQVEIATDETIQLIVKRADEAGEYRPVYNIDESLLNEDGEHTAQIKKGDVVGTMTLQYSGEDYGFISDEMQNSLTVNLVAQEDVEKANWFSLMLRAIGEFFFNLFTSVIGWFKGLF